MSKGSLLLGALICVLCTNAVAGWVCDGARPGIVAAEVDPVFVGYSNSTAFVADVRAAQTNDGYEADTTYMDDLASFTNAVRVAQTNMVEADPVFAATGALQVDLVAVSNKAAAAYGWGDHNRLYLNLTEPLVYDANGSALHFQVEWQ